LAGFARRGLPPGRFEANLAAKFVVVRKKFKVPWTPPARRQRSRNAPGPPPHTGAPARAVWPHLLATFFKPCFQALFDLDFRVLLLVFAKVQSTLANARAARLRRKLHHPPLAGEGRPPARFGAIISQLWARSHFASPGFLEFSSLDFGQFRPIFAKKCPTTLARAAAPPMR